MAKQPCFMVILHNKLLLYYIIFIKNLKACDYSVASLNALIHAGALLDIKDNNGEKVLDYG